MVSWQARTALLSACLLLSVVQPGLAGVVHDPPAHGIGLGIAASVGGAAVVAAAQEARAACLRDRVQALCSPQIRSVDPEGRIFSLHDLGEYESCLSALKSLLAFEPVISRPAPKAPLNGDGQRVVNPGKFVMPVESRPVQVLDDRLEHWRQALTCQARPQGTYSLPPACVKAVDHMLGLGHKLPAWRAKQVRALQGISKRASRLTRTLKASWALGAAVQRLEHDVRKVNVVLLMLLCDALEHPDVGLPRAYLSGFPVTGVLPDSHVLRPQPAADPEELFWTRYHDTMRSNDQWAEQLATKVADQARSAPRKRLALLRQSWELTKADIRSGFCGKPMTLAQLRAKYGSGANMACRPIQRHGVVQGKKPKCDDHGQPLTQPDGRPVMVDKIRLCDDSRRSLHNTHLIRTCETVSPCAFTYLSHVCDCVVRRASARGLPVPAVVFSTDDMRAAYRQIPPSDPEMCIVCIYSFDQGEVGPRFVENWGHNFGHSSSVSNYWRTPLLCCQAARHFLAIPVDHYCDDYATPDFKLASAPDCGAASGLAALHAAIGLILQPDKHQPPAAINTFLGVVCDVSRAHTSQPFVEFRPSAQRTDGVLAMLDEGAACGLSPHSAQVIKGKISWILQSAWGCVGRAAAQPLVSRAGGRKFLLPGGRAPPPETHEWTPALQDMTEFFRTLFRSLPPLRAFLGIPRRAPVVVYSDAQYSVDGRKGLGVIITDVESGASRMCGAEIPLDLLQWMDSFGTRKKQRVNQCELLALLGAVLTFGEVMRDREILVWVDNVPTLSAAVNGYSHAPEMAALSNALHLRLAGLSARPYFRHVPGKANPADIPSRIPIVRHGAGLAIDRSRFRAGDARVIDGIGAVCQPMLLPTSAQLSDLAHFIKCEV
jgi:hypothetical protein